MLSALSNKHIVLHFKKMTAASCIIFSVMDLGFYFHNDLFELPNGHIFVDIFMFTSILFELP